MGSVAVDPTALHIERDLKLSVPDRFRLPGLQGLGLLRPERPKRSTTTFYDTSDLALAAWGCLLRYRTGEGWTVKLPDSGTGEGLERAEQAFDGKDGDPPEGALDLIAPFLRRRPVAAVARMRTVRRRISVLDADGANLLDVVDDRVSTSDGEPRTMRQIEIELHDLAAADVRQQVVRRLVAAGAKAGDRRTKYEWVLGDRRPPHEVDIPRLTARSSASVVIRAALASSVIGLVRKSADIHSVRDPEPVHQARVAVRRLRSDLRTFKSILAADWSAELRAELDWLGEALGAVRDREVLSERVRARSGELPDATGIRPVLRTLSEEIRSGRRELAEVLRSDRCFLLLDRLVDAARAPVLAVPDGPAADLLWPAVDRAWKRLRRAVRTAKGDESSNELHLVRIEAKRLRYTCEAVRTIFGKPAVGLAKAATKLQDVLGEHQDAVVAQGWLRDHSDTDGAATAFALGELAALELVARDDAKARWAASWKKLQPWRPAKWA